jgi:hypothetical protein
MLLKQANIQIEAMSHDDLVDLISLGIIEGGNDFDIK